MALHFAPTSRLMTAGIAGVVLALSALALTGCASETATPVATQSAATSSTPKVTSSKTAAATPTSTPLSLVGEPTGFSCDSVLTLQELFDFNQNYYLSTAKTQDLGDTLGKQVSSLSGITCDYASQSDGALIQLSLVKIEGKGIDRVKSELSSSGKSTSAYGQEPKTSAFFVSTGDVGTINVVIGNFWLSASSAAFTAPEDATKFLSPVIEKLQ